MLCQEGAPPEWIPVIPIPDHEHKSITRVQSAHLVLQLLHALLQLLALPLGLSLQLGQGLSLLTAQGSFGLLQCTAQLLSMRGVLLHLA